MLLRRVAISAAHVLPIPYTELKLPMSRALSILRIRALPMMRRLGELSNHLAFSSSARPGPESFITRANSEGLQSLLGEFEATSRFDRVLEGMRITSIAAGRVRLFGRSTGSSGF